MAGQTGRSVSRKDKKVGGREGGASTTEGQVQAAWEPRQQALRLDGRGLR